VGLLFFLLIAVNSDKVVEIRFVEKAPIIDGIIEEIWDIADSATNFIQVLPYEKQPPSEKTVVYLMQDSDNLYVSFRAYTKKYKCVSCLGGTEDYVRLYLDPFGSKNTAYYFTANASGQLTTGDDGLILDDGRRRDQTWDGVYYRGVKIYDNYYTVEYKIPFKSIRYKKGLPEWGVSFSRYITKNNEYDYWTEVNAINRDIVSRYGVLRGINPKSKGHHFELYPEGYIRYDKWGEEEGKVKPFGSLNFKWDFTSEGTFSATINPDFAQIEADPFSLNLSRYPIYLEERRPFFLEGSEIFRFSNFEEGSDFYSPLNIFYSRTIGRSIDGEPIPILCGLKLTNRAEDWNLGVLGAYTDSLKQEPKRGFSIVRLKHRVLENSEMGVLFSGSMANKNNYNYAVGIDGAYLSGQKQFIFQSALSERNGKRGWALSSGYYGFSRRFMSIAVFEVMNDSFDVSDIGYAPWAGRKRILLITGPYKNYDKGFLRRITIAPLFSARKEPGILNWSNVGGFFVSTSFRNGWGFYFEADAGSHYQADTNYFYRAANLSVWGRGEKYYTNFGGYYGYQYNYRREFIAYQGSNWFSLTYTPIPRISLILDGNMWTEWDTTSTIIAVTPRLTPRVRLNLSKDMELSIFNEFVMEAPGVDLQDTELLSNRIGLLFSWNFRPKSWLYIALNDYRVQDEYGNPRLENQIGAIKAKYLFYF
jgi:hypothetical protein